MFFQPMGIIRQQIYSIVNTPLSWCVYFFVTCIFFQVFMLKICIIQKFLFILHNQM